MKKTILPDWVQQLEGIEEEVQSKSEVKNDKSN
jgi:hypothetical protein